MPSKHDPLPPGVDVSTYFRVGTVWPSPPDPLDYRLATAPPVTLPVAWSHPEVPRRNQGNRGSCGAFGTIRIAEHELRKAGVQYDASEETEYSWTRELMNMLCQDSGSYVRTAMSIPVDIGIVSEAQVPYGSRDLCWKADQWRQAASQLRMLRYVKVNGDIQSLKAAIYGSNGTDGRKVSACFLLYENFYQVGRDGAWPRPSGRQIGGHWMTFEGYDDARRVFKIANSWSEGWGDRGFVYMPYDFFSLSPNQGGPWVDDFWTFEYAAAPPPPPPPDPEPDANKAFREGFEWEKAQVLAHLDQSRQAYAQMALQPGYTEDQRKRYAWVSSAYLPWEMGNIRGDASPRSTDTTISPWGVPE